MDFEQADLSEGCPIIFLEVCPLYYILEGCPTIYLGACPLNIFRRVVQYIFDIGVCPMSFKKKILF